MSAIFDKGLDTQTRDCLLLVIAERGGKSHSFTSRAAANAYVTWSNQRERPDDLPDASVVVPHALPGLYERTHNIHDDDWVRQSDL